MPEPTHDVRFEPDDKCPWLIALSVGMQGIPMVLTSMVLIVAVTVHASGELQALTWTMFATLVISGVMTVVQAARFGRLGTGYTLVMGPTLIYTALIVLAVEAGGPSLAASLIVVASLLYLALGHWLPTARRIITPVVPGTMLMLIAATLLPYAIQPILQIRQDSPKASGAVIAIATIAASVLLAWRARGVWGLWAPLISISVGCVAAVPFGVYELDHLRDAAWIGLPPVDIPGLEFSPGSEFWSLLPAFVLVAFVGGLRNIGDDMAVQQSSRRQQRATDFRAIQRSLHTEGLAMLLAGLAGTPPIATYGGESAALTTFTGVAARRVGYVIGTVLILLASSPKMTSVLVALPAAVIGAYLLVMLALMFINGMRTVVYNGFDSKQALIVGVSFCLGVGLDAESQSAALLDPAWGFLVGNGIVAGALCATLLSIALHLTHMPKWRTRLDVELSPASLPQIDDFVKAISSRLEWSEDDAHRLRATSEEALHSVLEFSEQQPDLNAPSLIVRAKPSNDAIELEFVAVSDAANIEDRLANLSDEAMAASAAYGSELPLRLLRHYAHSVQHQKFYGLDIVTVQVRRATPPTVGLPVP